MFTRQKGQLQVNITIFVLVVFVILLFLSLAVYFKFTYRSIEKNKEEILEHRYSGLLSVVLNMPELKYSIGGVEKQYFDAVKLEVFNSISSKYDGVFSGVNGIYVEVVYPDPGEFLIFGNKDAVGLRYSIPVAVYYPVGKEYKIGKLVIIGEK